jgi:peptidoglycan/LPS O-acetylase OafA/YrhL
MRARPAGPNRTFLPWVQALRAFAALSVAFLHVAHDDIANGADPRGIFTAITNFFPWYAGVDIFFVISGFVIVHASARLFATKNAPWHFLRRRLSRIVPLYWLMTTAFIAVLLAGRAQIHGDIGGSLYLTASYLFIPWPRPDGVMQPAFGLGWTLNYEMFFYLLFTPFLLLTQRRAAIAAGLLLLALTALGPFLTFSRQLAFWSDPIILEFVFGMALALAAARHIVLPTLIRALLILAAIAAFHINAAGHGLRPLIFGLPAAAIVACAVLTTPKPAIGAVEKLLVRLGDASYALYLVHPFVMRALSALWQKIHAQNEILGTIYVLAGLTVAQILALIINATLERQFLTRMRGIRL